MPNPTMSADEREAFLADTHVGVFSVSDPGRGPCTVPVWYSYAPGEPIRITMAPQSRKAKLLRAVGRASLCVQREALPYKYVSVEGSIEIVEADLRALQREIAERYLGPSLAARYVAKFSELRDEVLVLLRPERWWSVDFSRVSLG